MSHDPLPIEKTKVGFKMADFKMAAMVTTHLEKFPPSHILMCHKQEVNITNHSHFIKVYPDKWPTLYIDVVKPPFFASSDTWGACLASVSLSGVGA